MTTNDYRILAGSVANWISCTNSIKANKAKLDEVKEHLNNAVFVGYLMHYLSEEKQPLLLTYLEQE
jgi:hypothetical protein